MSAAPLPNTRPLPMRPSRREMDAFVPGASWDLTPYLPWLKAQAERRGVGQVLFVLTATHCDGCRTLKKQLETGWAALEHRALVVLAQGGDLFGPCFFTIRAGDMEVRAPGLPTAYLLDSVENAFQPIATSLGPIDEPDIKQTLTHLLDGKSRACREAQGISLEIRSREKPFNQAFSSLPPIEIP